MKILAIGDITSPGGALHLEKNLWGVRKKFGIDFTVVNGENASFIMGVASEAAEKLLRSGADVITGGNHTIQNFNAHKMLDETPEVLRPLNYPEGTIGKGFTVCDIGIAKILVINVLGCVHMEPVLDSPFFAVEKALRENAGKYDFAVLDIHAEATGEKLALGHYFDGKINVIFGTHTHVPTADGRILPKGTGYISDLGMCGESGGILGIDPSGVIHKMRNKMPGKFKCADGEVVADGVIFTLDDLTKRVTEIKRIKF